MGKRVVAAFKTFNEPRMRKLALPMLSPLGTDWQDPSEGGKREPGAVRPECVHEAITDSNWKWQKSNLPLWKSTQTKCFYSYTSEIGEGPDLKTQFFWAGHSDFPVAWSMWRGGLWWLCPHESDLLAAIHMMKLTNQSMVHSPHLPVLILVTHVPRI